MASSRTYGRYSNNPRENYSLKVEDIAGARPKPSLTSKKVQHYQDKLMMEPKIVNQNTQQSSEGAQSPLKQKYYNLHYESEIAKHNLFKGADAAQPELCTFDYPRNLSTQDIPGASPGTLQSKVVKNHELAQKLRQFHDVSEDQIKKNPEDSLDKFKKEYSKYTALDFQNPYDRMNHNYHFRSSYMGEYQMPENRATLKPKEIKSIYHGPNYEKNERKSFLSREEQKPSGETLLKTEKLSINAQYQQNEAISALNNQPESLHPSLVDSPIIQKNTQQTEHSVENSVFQKNDQNFYREYIPIPNESHIVTHNLPENKGSGRSRSTDVEPMIHSTETDVKTNVEQYFGGNILNGDEEFSRNYNNFYTAKRNSSGNLPVYPTSKHNFGMVENKSVNDYKKIYTYNIIANQPIPKVLPAKTRLPYGYAISVDSGTFDALKRLEAKNDSSIENRKFSSNLLTERREDYEAKRMPKFPEHYYAGKFNAYGEVNGRYENKLSNKQEVNTSDKYFGIRGLKNLSEI